MRFKLRAALESIQIRDPMLSAELQARLATGRHEGGFVRNEAAISGQLDLESIVLRMGRPVLAIQEDQVQINLDDAESATWRTRLKDVRSNLEVPIRAVGKVFVKGHPSFTWIGTGWMLRHDILVTNRHVANEFARMGDAQFQFSIGVSGQPMSADIDFLEEIGNSNSRAFNISSILWVEPHGGPDLAFLKVSGTKLPTPIRLSEIAVPPDLQVAAIGYPARDSRIPEQDFMLQLFGNVFDKKRFAPGQVMSKDAGIVRHDCSTLGGNSGSALIDLGSGNAIGIHFAGRFLEANYAVASDRIAESLHRVEHGNGRRLTVEPGRAEARPADTLDSTVTINLPIRLSISVDAFIAPGSSSSSIPGIQVRAIGNKSNPEPDDEDGVDEGRVQDYVDRTGYRADFLGAGNEIELPEIVTGRAQILTYGPSGEAELPYQHFSVVMNKRRRMCFYSAVNIDGKNSQRKLARPGWIFDPRISKEFQIQGECYGNSPKFSRGHMTRREDPAWGSMGAALLGNMDSMHLTNAVPQMQAFNGVIWLKLEDYALANARKDDMRISVFTGPIFHKDDPTHYGVKIPLRFWKVIAFIHDETGELSATGYTISQSDFIQDEEFVYGAFGTYQCSLAQIERETGISFGGLSRADQFQELEAIQWVPLKGEKDIRWRG